MLNILRASVSLPYMSGMQSGRAVLYCHDFRKEFIEPKMRALNSSINFV